MDKWRGKVAIVTGASSGIGAVTSRVLTSHGVHVVGLARRGDRLQQVAEELSGGSGKFYPLKTDLRKEEDILTAFSWIDDQLGGAEILVNNAGIYTTSYLSEGKMEDWRAMFDVNVLAVCLCTKLFLKSLEIRGKHLGHIFIINSISGHTTEMAEEGVYCGTKYAVRAISKALRRELATTNNKIKVTSISPGAVATDIFTGTHLEEDIKQDVMLEAGNVTQVVVDSLSATQVSQVCEVVLNPVPTTTNTGFY